MPPTKETLACSFTSACSMAVLKKFLHINCMQKSFIFLIFYVVHNMNNVLWFCKRPFSTLFILFHSTSKRLTYGINKDRYWAFYINVKLKQDIFFIFNRKTKKWTKNFLINLNDSITVLWCMATCIYRYIQVCLQN